MLHRKTDLAELAASTGASGLNATLVTGVRPGTCSTVRRWVETFQIRIVPFDPPAASRFPFGLNATLVTAPASSRIFASCP